MKGEMTGLRVESAFASDPISVPSRYVRWLTTTHNSSSRVPNASGLRGYLHSCAHTDNKNTHNSK